MGLYALYKGSPIGLGKNIADSIKVGRWKHNDLKRQQEQVDAFLASTGMSPQGVDAVSRLIRQGRRATRSTRTSRPTMPRSWPASRTICMSKPVIA